MTGWKLTAAKLIAIVGLLIAGIGVSAAFADPGNGNGNGPPTTTPGSPGDNCSHGNSDKDCRPDPNQNGQDCEDHGNASGNEDHCDQVDTTTTTTTSTTDTTTTDTTTTTKTTTSSTTTSPTTSNPGPPGTPPSPPGNDGQSSSQPAGPDSSSASPVTKPELKNELAQQVKGAQKGRVSHASAKPGELPFTGFPAWTLALIGSVLLSAGLGLRRLAS
jgi:hypothetical protein